VRSQYTQPAVIGGLVMGVLSALPFVSAGNFCCCLWVIGGGVVAAYVLQQNQSTPITPGDGALVGLLAGLAGAFIEVAVSIPISLVVGPLERALTTRVLDMAGNMPPEFQEVLQRINREGPSGAWFIVAHVLGLMMWLCVGAVFSTLGGLLGAAIFKKNLPPGTIDATPIPPGA
jgi:hypothetical protein